MSRARSGSEALADESGGDMGELAEPQWEAGDQRKKGKGGKGSKADADRVRARELAEAEEAVARWGSLCVHASLLCCPANILDNATCLLVMAGASLHACRGHSLV